MANVTPTGTQGFDLRVRIIFALFLLLLVNLWVDSVYSARGMKLSDDLSHDKVSIYFCSQDRTYWGILRLAKISQKDSSFYTFHIRRTPGSKIFVL